VRLIKKIIYFYELTVLLLTWEKCQPLAKAPPQTIRGHENDKVYQGQIQKVLLGKISAKNP